MTRLQDVSEEDDWTSEDADLVLEAALEAGQVNLSAAFGQTTEAHVAEAAAEPSADAAAAPEALVKSRPKPAPTPIRSFPSIKGLSQGRTSNGTARGPPGRSPPFSLETSEKGQDRRLQPGVGAGGARDGARALRTTAPGSVSAKLGVPNPSQTWK